MTYEPITLVEIDIPVCSLTYGTAPCTAELGVTGDIKCFNAVRTCQDRAHFTRTVLTVRFCKATPDLPYEAIPSVVGVSPSPPELDPGNSMGLRASVSVTLGDHPTGDALFDKYIADRAYTPFNSGTFWPKFRARFPSIEGCPLRILRGQVGDALVDMRTEHYFVTGMGLDADGVKITAKDALSFCDPKKAQCPLPSTGKLSAAIDEDDMAFTLTPAGVGNAEYPASGELCLSNKEVVTFTRSADTVTITAREQRGTTAMDHSEDAVAQLVKLYTSQSAADVVYDLLVNFTPGIDPAWCNLSAWQSEADSYIGHLYTTAIPAPTSVQTLINELCQQAGVNIWADAETNTVQFRTLRPVVPSASVYDQDRILAGTLRTKEEPQSRISLALTFYAVNNVVEKAEKEPNYRASVLTADEEADQDYDGFPAFKKFYSRWIGPTGRAAAERLNNMQLSRFRDPPRRLAFSLFGTDPSPPALGEGIYLSGHCLQTATGAPDQVPAIVTSVTPNEDGNSYEAQELRFADSLVPGDSRTVYIDVDTFNVNLRELYDSLYGSLPEEATITFYITPGAWVGSTDADNPAMECLATDWPGDTILNLVIGTDGDDDSRVSGGGGRGANGTLTFAQAGGIGILATRALIVTNWGTIAGGGDGGAGANDGAQIGGGGGAGFNGYASGSTRIGGAGGPGTTTVTAQPGGTDIGGDPAIGDLVPEALAYRGEDLGIEGDAIDGVSFITFVETGTIVGDQV